MVDLGKNYDRFSDGMFFKLGESETLSARGVEGIKPPSKQEKHSMGIKIFRLGGGGDSPNP